MGAGSLGQKAGRLVVPLITGALIFLVSTGTIALTRGDNFISGVWLANAVLAAAFMRSAPRQWPALAAAGFAAFLGSHVVIGDSLVHSVTLSTLKLLEALIVVIPLNRWFGTGIDLGEVRPLGLALLLGGIVAPIVSGLGATAYYLLAEGSWSIAVLEQWVVSHALGFATLTPLLMALPRRLNFASVPPRILVELTLIIGLIAGVAALVYTSQAPLQGAIILCLVLAAFRLPTLAAALAVAVVAGEAILLTGLGLGPIAASQLDPLAKMQVLQASIAVAVLVTLPVSAVIHERDRLHMSVLLARDEAHAMADAKSNFLATMSHEIRTPMTGVLGMIELLRAEPSVAERDLYFSTLKQSATLLMTVLNDVLDYSKIESGNLELDSVDFDFEELARSTLDRFGPSASQKGLLISMHCDCRPGDIVRGDPVRLQQVMNNLISNAIKFTEQGRVTIAIRSLEQVEGYTIWRVEVRDTGIGVAGEHLEQLFQPFVQAEMSTSRRFGGTGLGLTISRWLVEAMGGTMGAESRPRRGSTFWFEIPLPEGDSIDWHAPPQTFAQSSRALEILVAEDNPVNQILIDAILRRFGHQATLVDNGQVAVEAASLRHFDCILMDMQMPIMDGLAATRAIRASSGPCTAVPIIALTADASPERRRFYDIAGLTDFMTKPIDRLALAARLAAIAGSPDARGDEDESEAVDAPLLDTTCINQLCAAIGSTQFDGLLDLLAVELEERPAAIRNAVLAGDVERARSEAHSLKGATMSIGAMALGQAAAATELAPDLEAMTATLKNLDRQVARTRKAVENLLPRSRPKRGTG